MNIFFVLLAQPSHDQGQNVALDNAPLGNKVPKGLQKVVLDLDDELLQKLYAQEEEKKKQAVEPKEDETAEPESEQPACKKSVYLGTAILCLLLGAFGAYVFLKSSSPPAKVATSLPPIVIQPPTPIPSTPHTFFFEPFYVEFVLDNQIHLLTCFLSTPNANRETHLELQDNMVSIRDAIYLYFKDLPFTALREPNNQEKFRKDITKLVNGILTKNRIAEIRFDKYEAI